MFEIVPHSMCVLRCAGKMFPYWTYLDFVEMCDQFASSAQCWDLFLTIFFLYLEWAAPSFTGSFLSGFLPFQPLPTWKSFVCRNKNEHFQALGSDLRNSLWEVLFSSDTGAKLGKTNTKNPKPSTQEVHLPGSAGVNSNALPAIEGNK